MGDPYEVLGVARTAPPEVVRAAYKALIRACHPDLDPAPEAEARAKQVNAAYDAIGAPDARAAYDREHPGPAASPPPAVSPVPPPYQGPPAPPHQGTAAPQARQATGPETTYALGRMLGPMAWTACILWAACAAAAIWHSLGAAASPQSAGSTPGWALAVGVGALLCAFHGRARLAGVVVLAAAGLISAVLTPSPASWAGVAASALAAAAAMTTRASLPF